MQNGNHEATYFRKSLKLICHDIKTDFYSQVHDIVFPYRYGNEDRDESNRDGQAKKLVAKCAESILDIISKRFNMIAGEWPNVFAAYEKLHDKIPNLINDGFMILFALRRNIGYPDVLTDEIRKNIR